MKKNNLVSLNYNNSFNLELRIKESCAGIIVLLQGEPQIETYKREKKR